jgi:hypothetical protein
MWSHWVDPYKRRHFTPKPPMDQCASCAHSRSGSVTDIAASTRSPEKIWWKGIDVGQ